ncbi:hypothetical protein Dsin_015034 [Dipteronia sinensis]|uniref:Uncharacterized protein n=1 Tax=Dipteronia sinensis TaxID=43782 RepID=A0AAE0EAL7_9ROSI|nr:hypothetical protein Dsin_015034 [Dipteronia sinensis]
MQQIFENVVHDHDQIIGGDQVPILTELGDQYFEDVPEMVPSTVEEVSHGVDQGLHLVHLLLACAEAVGCRDTQLADSMLSQNLASANPWGDSLKRVSYCFALGLKSRLSLLHNNINANGTFSYGITNVSLINRDEKMEAFHLLYQTTTYISFGFLSVNEALYFTSCARTSFLTEENLNLREGEALFVNSIMHLHKYVKESRGSLKAILQAIKRKKHCQAEAQIMPN